MRDSVPLSGFYYPNRMGRIYLMAMEEMLGRNAFNTLLGLSDMREFMRELPADDLKKGFDFAHISNLNQGLEDVYGEREMRNKTLRGGRVLFARGLQQFGALAGVGDLAFKVLPLPTKLKIGLPAIARIFTQFSDQTSYVEEAEDCYYYYIERCSMCWGRRQCERPIGHTAVGILQEALRWVGGGLEFRIEEQECIGMGAPRGVFRIDKEPIR
jgi:hypothetical protein